MNKAQRWYVLSGAYRLNRSIQANESPEEWMDAEDAKMARQFMAQFNKLSPITREMTLYRGINGQSSVPIGYMSASSESEVAENFVGVSVSKNERGDYEEQRTGLFAFVTVKPGVRVMNIGGVQAEYVIDHNVNVIETDRLSNVVWLTVEPK